MNTQEMNTYNANDISMKDVLGPRNKDYEDGYENGKRVGLSHLTFEGMAAAISDELIGRCRTAGCGEVAAENISKIREVIRIVDWQVTAAEQRKLERNLAERRAYGDTKAAFHQYFRQTYNEQIEKMRPVFQQKHAEAVARGPLTAVVLVAAGTPNCSIELMDVKAIPCDDHENYCPDGDGETYGYEIQDTECCFTASPRRIVISHGSNFGHNAGDDSSVYFVMGADRLRQYVINVIVEFEGDVAGVPAYENVWDRFENDEFQFFLSGGASGIRPAPDDQIDYGWIYSKEFEEIVRMAAAETMTSLEYGEYVRTLVEQYARN